jgi:hypothetical protein
MYDYETYFTYIVFTSPTFKKKVLGKLGKDWFREKNTINCLTYNKNCPPHIDLLHMNEIIRDSLLTCELVEIDKSWKLIFKAPSVAMTYTENNVLFSNKL